MTREDAIQQLKGLQVGGDIEAEHSRADEVLCELLTELGYADVVAKLAKVDKWYA